MSGSINNLNSVYEDDEEIQFYKDQIKADEAQLESYDEELKRLDEQLKRADAMSCLEIIKQLGQTIEKNMLPKIMEKIEKQTDNANERIKEINLQKKIISGNLNDLRRELKNLYTTKKNFPQTSSYKKEGRSKASASGVTGQTSPSQMSKVNNAQFDEIAETYSLDVTDIKLYPNHPITNNNFIRILNDITLDRELRLNESSIEAIPQSQEKDHTQTIIAQFESTNLGSRNHFFINLNEYPGNKKYQLPVPMLNNDVSGRSDIAIVKEAVKGKKELVVIIELKTLVNINKSESRNQGLFELIGATAKSDSPVLYVQTDMKTFHFMRIGERLEESTITTKITVFYYRCEFYDAIQLIQKWIIFVENASKKELGSSSLESYYNLIMDNVKRIKRRYCQLNSPLPKKDSLGNLKLTLKREDIERALRQQDTIIISNDTRTGRVYKINIAGKFYTVKIPSNQYQNRLVLAELRNEIDIYKRLSYLQKTHKISKLDDDEYRWPNLCYHGHLTLPNDEMLQLSIVSTFIDGDPIKRELRKPVKWQKVDESVKKECEMTLKRLNRLGIKHQDTRTPNFIWNSVEKKAFILDFGFSVIFSDKQHFEGLNDSSTKN